MKTIAMAVTVALIVGSGLASAQNRDGRTGSNYRGSVRDVQHVTRGWDRGGYRGGGTYYRHGGGYGGYPYPRSYGYYAAPYGYYFNPLPYAYSVPGPYVYGYAEQPPVVVERVYEEPVRIYQEPRQYERRQSEERNYAQAEPPAPRPPAPTPARPAPRFERYTLSATELFQFDQATLKNGQPKLDEIARVLMGNPQIGNVRITGYTDRLGSDAYNQKLSERRANAVKDYLVRQGVEKSRLSAIGKGEGNPVVQCNDRDKAALIRCLEPNRRVEVEEITIERQVTPTQR